MKQFLKLIARYLIGAILLFLSVIALMVMFAYYQESTAIWPGVAFAICFILSLVCFTEE